LQYTDKTKPTIKETTEQYNYISNTVPSFQTTHLQYTDKTKPTIKETTEQYNYTGTTVPSFQTTHLQYTDKTKPTIKETTEQYNYPGTTVPSFQTTHLQYTDKTKPTIKETTEQYNYTGNTVPIITGNIIQNNDLARPTHKETINTSYNGNPAYQISSYTNNNEPANNTHRETTENNNYIGIIGGQNNKELYTTYEDQPKNTIKETTLYETPIQNIIANVSDSYYKNDQDLRTTTKETILHSSQGGRMYDKNQSQYTTIEDAKITNKQTTLLENYKGTAINNIINPRIEDAEYNMSINDMRQQTSLGGRIGNAKTDKIRADINYNTVKFQNKRPLLEGYISAGGLSMNANITPLEHVTSNKKTNLTDNNFYRIDPLYISELNKNPLVNNIINPKLQN